MKFIVNTDMNAYRVSFLRRLTRKREVFLIYCRNIYQAENIVKKYLDDRTIEYSGFLVDNLTMMGETIEIDY